MFHIKDHHTIRLFDPWSYMGPKCRKLLESNWAGVFRKHLLKEIPVNKIAQHFDGGMGRPTKEIFTVIGALLLQQMQDLSDQDVTESIAFNSKWHYALDITGESDDDKYICERTLRHYRKILIEERLDSILFEKLTDTLIKKFNVDTSKQRIDSTHIRSNMRNLGRISLFAVTIKKFLNTLKRKYSDLFESLIDSEIASRYLDKKDNGCFSKVKPSDAAKSLQQLAEDLLYLVELFSSNEKIKNISSYRLLKRLLSEQCRVVDKKVEIKKPKEVPSDSLQNPSDPDATYDGYKGSGYQVQIMETYYDSDKDNKEEKPKPNLITYVDVEPAHNHDSEALQPAIDNTQERGCSPDELQCDTLYGSDENVSKAKEKGVTVIAPAIGPKNSKKAALKDFTFDDETGLIKDCPEGHKPQRVNKTKSNNLTARFSKEHCGVCSRRDKCPVKFHKKVTYVQYTEKQLRLAIRRKHEETPEFLDKYRWRSGIEGTNSHYKSDTGAFRLRVRELARVRFSAVLKALGLNILRSARAFSLSFWSNLLLIFGIRKHAAVELTFPPKADPPLAENPNSRYYLSKNNKIYKFAL